MNDMHLFHKYKKTAEFGGGKLFECKKCKKWYIRGDETGDITKYFDVGKFERMNVAGNKWLVFFIRPKGSNWKEYKPNIIFTERI